MAVTSAQVQELYVGLLGRAADQEGLNYWLGELNATPAAMTLEDVRANFVNEQQEYADIYGGLNREQTVTQIYANLFERAPDAEGLAYWTTGAGASVNIDQLVVAFINGASAADSTTVANKVFVAQAYTAAAGLSAFDAAAAAQIIADVDGTTASVTTALGDLPLSTDTLSAALATWEAANVAKDDFLAGLDLDSDPATATVEADVTALVNPATTGEPVSLFNANIYSTVNLAAASTAAQQTAAYSAARAAVVSAIADQQAVVDGAQAAVDALSDAKDVATYTAAVAAAEVTQAALEPANAAAAGAVAAYNAFASNTDVAQANYTVMGTVVSIVGASPLAGVAEVKDGALVALTGVTETTNPGITALLNAINGDIAAIVADNKADTAVASAQTLVGDGTATADGYGAVDTLLTEQTGLADLQTASDDLETLITDVTDAYGLNAQLTSLNDNIQTAFDALSAGTDLNVVEGSGATTATPDLFLFDGNTDTIGTGFAADDLLFVGTGFSLVTVADGETVGSTSLGNVNALEVIWDAANSTLYVEQETFAGNATGTDDLTPIVLAGVTGDVTLSAEGFIQLA